MSYVKNILIGIDQLGNTIIGGSPDETISSRFGRAIIARKCIVCKWVCAVLDLFQKDHCIRSIEDKDRRDGEVIHLSDKNT